MAQITGNIFYLERIALPSNATLEVVLADVSRQDGTATLVAQQTMPLRGIPMPFVLDYESAAVDAGHTYVVRA